MDLSYSAEEIAFRDDVRAWLAENVPPEIADKVRSNQELTKAEMEDWHARLNARGWLAETWPVEFGGTGWGPVKRHIFDVETSRAHAPRVVPFGLNMLGPVLITFGTKEQQDHYLPRILDGTDWWCQGYSEPGAGSDLASLKTRADRDGDDYVINGQKTWTTMGQHADHIFCLVRTKQGGKPQEGISFVLVDMATPGIEVRPIKLIEGGFEVNEVFFTDVRVPVANRVGDENAGWTIAKFLLSHERTGIAGVGSSMQALEELRKLSREVKRNGKPLAESPLFAAQMAEVAIDLEAMKITNLRMLARAEATGAPGIETSMLKIKGSVIRQRLNDLARRALGHAAAPFPSEDLEDNLAIVPDGHAQNAAVYFNNRKVSIFGGSNEIQRNILSKHALGL